MGDDDGSQGIEPVALIVVHGVADQPRGETVQAVAEQLAAARGAAVARSDVPIEVHACAAAVPYTPWDTNTLGKRIWKSLGQSFGSDFLDPRLGGADSERARGKAACDKTPLANSAAAAANSTADPGARFTDFLFAKAQGAWPKSGAPSSLHNVACCALGGRGPPVELFEMYWADLSRLSGSATRILAELFTLLFDLMRVGRNTVAMHGVLFRAEPDAMRTLGRWHQWADWLYTRLLAMLTLQVLVCAVVVALASALEGHERGFAYLVAALAGSALALALVDLRLGKRYAWTAGALAGATCGALLAACAYAAAENSPARLQFALLVLALAALGWAYERLLAYWEERFRAVYGFGAAFGAVTLACLAWGLTRSADAPAVEGVIAGAMRALELLLAAQVLCWIALALLCAGIVALGRHAGRGDNDAAAQRRQVIRTGRLGLFASLGAFVVFTMALWALVDRPLREAVFWVRSRPLWFDKGCSDAECFLRLRFEGSTETFALVALLLSLAFGFATAVLLPCIAIEVGRLRGMAAPRIGVWLTVGYGALERLLRWWSWVVVAGMLAAALLLLAPQLARLGIAPGEAIACASLWLRESSGWLLRIIVLAVAGGTTGLLAIGRVGFKRLQALRTPLDAALDVDVHFREFPRNAIPRVRIAERYVALLEQVLDAGFRRIVIVAHSQGTVITADLLRYLQQRRLLFGAEKAKADADRLVRLGQRLARDVQVDLLTVGSPLRQLYATRFPGLYGWVLGAHGARITGPRPHELGLRRWVNLWGAADYVGRWLWSDGERVEPLSLAVDARAYDGVPLGDTDRFDRCIGAAAHTHYFELDQSAVRLAVTHLIEHAPPAAPAVA